MMKMTRNFRMQSLISLIALSLGLCFVSPASAEIFLLDSSGKVLSEFRVRPYAQVNDAGGTIVYGINDAGQVAGWSDTGVSPSHAFITGPNGGGMTDLNSLALASLLPEYVIRNAIGINNARQVLIVATIPEPETYTLMLAGLGLIGFVAWRQKSGNRI